MLLSCTKSIPDKMCSEQANAINTVIVVDDTCCTRLIKTRIFAGPSQLADRAKGREVVLAAAMWQLVEKNIQQTRTVA